MTHASVVTCQRCVGACLLIAATQRDISVKERMARAGGSVLAGIALWAYLFAFSREHLCSSSHQLRCNHFAIALARQWGRCGGARRDRGRGGSGHTVRAHLLETDIAVSSRAGNGQQNANDILGVMEEAQRKKRQETI